MLGEGINRVSIFEEVPFKGDLKKVETVLLSIWVKSFHEEG